MEQYRVLVLQTLFSTSLAVISITHTAKNCFELQLLLPQKKQSSPNDTESVLFYGVCIYILNKSPIFI